MKKRYLVLLLVVTVAFLSLFSCRAKNKGDGGADSAGVIYDSSTRLAIVRGTVQTDEANNAILSLYEALSDKVNGTLDIVAPDSSPREHEIVIGKSNRPISAEAYSKLERIRLDPEQEDEGWPRVLIYTDGSSVAIAYDESEKDLALIYVIEHFVKNYTGGDSLSLSAGVIYKNVFDIDAYYQAIDDAYVAQKWLELENAIGGELGKDVVSSFKKLYALYTDDMISWFANLYDPAIGGWYYSNSGRNTDGYLPDAESTQQALRFIDDSGMIDTIAPNGYEDALPEEMKEAIGSFIYNLQDPNGYFYHPQWSKDAIDNKTSRRSRDLGWCTGILNNLGITPKYTTPSGVTGEGVEGASAVYLAGRLGSSTVGAVSKVIAAEDVSVAVDPKLKDKDSFIKYLDSLNITTNSYSAGNTLTAFYSEIEARDKALQEQNVGYSLVEIMINYLNDIQFDNGTWHAEINYYAINGFMKMSGVYSKSGSPLPNSHKALESCIAAITSDEEPGAITDIYNTWFATSRAFNIIKNTEGDAGKAYVEEQRQKLLENAPAAIELTAKRIAKYLKSDGSFSYSPDGAPKTSQGMPVAVGANEGDINGTLLCSSDLLTYVYGALGISKYRVPTHTYNDWRHYVGILNELQPVIKDEEESVYEPETFDELPLGAVEVDEISVNDRSSTLGGGIAVVDDPRDTTKKVLKVTSVATKSDAVNITSPNLSHAFSCFAFEGDFCLVSSNTDFPIRITMGESYIVSIKIKDGKVIFVESSSETPSKSKDVILPMSANMGEWFRLKIEYYKGDHSTVRIKIYFDDNLTDEVGEQLVAVSNNYLDQNGDKFINGIGEPALQFSNTQFWFMKAYDIEFMMDNVCSYKLDKKYAKYTDKENPLKLNVDAPVAEDGDDATSKPAYTDTYYNLESVPGTRHDYSEKLNKNYIYNKSYDAETEEVTVSVPICTDIYGGKLNVSNLSNWAGFAIANHSNTVGVAGAKYVFDTTFIWKGGSQKADAGAAAYVGPLGEHLSVDNNYMMSYFTVSFTDDPNVLLFGGAELEKGKAYNIRIEYIVGGGIELFVDNVGVIVSASKGSSADEMNFLGFGMYMRKNFIDPFEFTLDDTFLGIVYPDGTDIPIVPDNPYAPPEDPGLPENLETMYGNPEHTGTRYDFEANVGSDKLYNKTVDKETGESVVTLPAVTKIEGGKLFIDNNGSTYKGVALKNLGNTAGGVGSTYVFEADFRWTSGHQATAQLASGAAFIGFLGDHASVDNNYMSGFGYIKFVEGEQDVMLLCGAELTRGTTYNIRIEYTVGSYATVYVNGEVANRFTMSVGANADKSTYEGFGLYIRKSIAPDLEFTLDNVYMDVIPKKPTEKVSVLNTPTGADGIVVLMHDDGTLDTVEILDKVFKEYGLVGNVALLGNKVYANGAYNTANIAKWQSYLDTGRWQISSHSMTHAFWGLTDKAETVYDTDGTTVLATITEDGMITYEVVTSAEILRTAFPSQRVLTFAYPGFWAQRSLGMDRFSAVARALVANTYIAGRDSYGNKNIDLQNDSTDWKFAPSYQLDAGNVSEILDVVERAKYGEMAVVFTHKVVSDDTESLGSNTMYEKDFRKVAAKISELQSTGKIWSAFYEDAVLYTREKQAASLAFTESEGEIRITLTTPGLDNTVYNYPLTVRALVPAEWEAVKVTQGESVSYAKINTLDGERFADVSVVPGDGVAVLTPASIEDVSFYTYFGDENVTSGNRYDFEDGKLPETVITNTVDGANHYTEPDTVIVTDESGNHVLSETSTKWKGFAIITGDDTVYTSGKYVFETDFIMNKAVYRSSGALFAGFITYADQYKDGTVICENTTSNAAAFADSYVVVSEDATTYTWFGYTLKVGQRYNLRAVYDVETDVCAIYVDGELVSAAEYGTSNDTKGRDDSVYRGFMFYPRVSGCEFTLDNVYIGIVEKDTSLPEPPTDPDTPTPPVNPTLPEITDEEDAPKIGDIDTGEWYG